MEMQDCAELIGAIYAVALDAQGWQRVLAELAAFFDCTSAAMRIIDTDDFHVVLELATGTGEADAAAYAGHFASVLPHMDMLKAASNHYVDDVFVVGAHEVLRLQFADALDGRLKRGRDTRGFVFKIDSRIVHIAMRCAGDAQAQGEGLTRALPVLVPHLQRAYQITRRMSELACRADSLEQTLDCFSSGVIMIDGRGVPVHLNRRAREIVARMPGLNIVPGQPLGGSTQGTQQLRRLAAAAVQHGRQGSHDVGAMSAQGASEGGIDLAIVAVPLHADTQAMAPQEGGIHAALLLGSPDFASDLQPAILQLLANLTAAEARLALALAAGKTLEQYCRDSGIQIGTGRSYLKQVFQKTGTNRQPELVSLVRSMPFYL